jgi:hypothetical protein
MVLVGASSAKLVDAYGASFSADVTQAAPPVIDQPGGRVSV